MTRFSRGYGALRRGAANGYLRLAYFFVLALVAKWPTLATATLLNDFRDAQYLTLFEEAARTAVARFHQLPLWDPYYCGGVYGLGTPQARWLSPTFLLTLAFGTLRGNALTMFAMTVVGLEGTFRYLRHRGAGAFAATTAAPVFALSGLFAHAAILGWTNFFGFELVPWALWGTRRALRGSRRGTVIAALAVAWMIGFGGTYTGPLTLLIAAVEVLEALAERARRPAAMGRVLAMGALIVLLATGLSLARLWPVAETLSASPRIIGGTPGELPRRVWAFLFGSRADHFRRGEFLVGLPVLPLVLLGSGRRRAWPLTFSALIWVWLAMGYKAPGPPAASLFALLRSVPPYTMLRAPERFLVFVALGAAGVGALGLRWLEIGGHRRAEWLVLAALGHATLLADSALLVANDHAEAASRKMVVAPTAIAREFHQSRGNRWLAAYYPFMSRGTLSCFDDYDVAQSPELRGDLRHEEHFEDPAAGQLTEHRWSPDRIDLHVDTVHAVTVVVNQNWHPGWRSSIGAVESKDGQLAIDVPEGSHDLSLRFLPRSAVGGFGATLLGVFASALMWRRARHGDDVDLGRDWLSVAGICALPFTAAIASFALLHEPKRPAPPAMTPAGEPMIVDTPPAASRPIGARWADGIVLEASALDIEPSADGHGRLVTLELDWRIEQKLPAGLGVFVHYETGPKNHFAADHVLLSGALPFDGAPARRTVRDVADPFLISSSDRNETWKVYVGIWRARGDEARIKVTSGGEGYAGDDRVLAGVFEVPQED